MEPPSWPARFSRLRQLFWLFSAPEPKKLSFSFLVRANQKHLSIIFSRILNTIICYLGFDRIPIKSCDAKAYVSQLFAARDKN
jgi:hypothetical protein